MPAFDAVTTYLAVEELARLIVPGKLRKVRQLSPQVLLLTLWRGRDESVLISLQPTAARIHRVVNEYGPASVPSAFCMLLRKHLLDKRVEACYSYGLERIVRLDLTGSGREGTEDSEERASLVVELLPRSRNLILLDGEDRVLGDHARSLRRGDLYQPPLPATQDALSIPGVLLATGLRELASVDATLTLARALPKAAFGLAPQQARLLLDMARLDGSTPLQAFAEAPPLQSALANTWDAMSRRLQEGDLKPCLHDSPQGGLLVLPWPGPTLQATTSAASWGELLEQVYGAGSSEAALEQSRALLLSRLGKHRERLERKLAAQRADAQEAELAETWRHQGDLLTAHLHLVKPQATSVTVPDYTQEGHPLVRISLDPQRSPQQCAQLLYQRYKKSLRQQASLAEAVQRTEEDLRYLDELEAATQTAQGRDELEWLSSEVGGEQVASRGREESKTRGKGPLARPRRYDIQGYEILVGRHPKQNEMLTRTLARPHDLWLHARQVPGAHVLVRTHGPGREVPEDVLLAAAALAAASSRAAQATRVAVDCTQARYVRKPPGAPAGFAVYSREQTIYAEPERGRALEARRKA